MKFVVLILLCSTLCSAQTYKKLRVGIGSGYANVGQEYREYSDNNQVLFYLEPSYRLSDQLSVGCRLEVTPGKTVASYTLNAQYYWVKDQTNFRPFVGWGIGFYHPYLTGDVFYGITSRQEQTVFGFYPRVGFDYGHLSLFIDWNIGGYANATIYPPAGSLLPPFDGNLSPNYFSLKLGLQIGGGKKKIKSP
ncbi:MAG TPA: hypothetical protein VGQ59_04995 [Cyclobacteriaceae bacterium]|nr:hypothetical protein [Cyclobacteriaceae bacterium]